MEWMEIAGKLRAAVALGLAMGSVGCGPSVDPDGGETDGETGGETDGGSGSSSTSGPIATTGSNCAPEGDFPECRPEADGFEVIEPYCIQLSQGESCDILVVEQRLLDAARLCLSCSGSPESVECGPFRAGDASCCAWILVEPGPSCPGRPFLVEGRARVPGIIERDDWSRPCSPNLEGLSASVRSTLAQAWAAEGCHEAASVASFSRFVLQLMSLGAPSSLVANAQSAMADEVEHARAFFGLARAYGGVNLGPDALSIMGALDEASDPIASAVSLATEGCIAETVSAMQLGLAASRATDPEVSAVLAEIAEQELRHAELAWSALAWMLQRGDAPLRAAVAQAFSQAQDAVPRAVSISDGLDPQVLNSSGRLTAEQRLDVAHRALEHCVAPAAAALLQPWTMTVAPPKAIMIPRRVVPAHA